MRHSLKIHTATSRGLGPEIIPDPEFDVDAEWLKDAGWTVGSSLATATDVASSFVIQIEVADRPAVIAGERFQWVIVVNSVTAGGFAWASSASWAIGPTLSAAGSYSGIAIATASGSPSVAIRAVGTTSGTISRFSLRKFL